MHNCTSNCIESTSELLTSILQQEVAISIRLSQVVQAFETSAGQPQSDQGDILTPDNVCSQSETGLLAAILEQRIVNFNLLSLINAAI